MSQPEGHDSRGHSPASQNGPAAPRAPTRRQFVRFGFFKLDPAWRRLPAEEQRDQKLELASAIESFGQRMLVRPYSLIGTRGDAELLLWQVADTLEPLHHLAATILRTRLGAYLDQPYAFLAMTRRSIYEFPPHDEATPERATVRPGEARYLFVYPFVKTRAWYALPQAERQRMMDEHIAVGRKYPRIKLNTTYSYGLDDQEFVVAFEGDDPAEFLDLVMELRTSEASAYTLRDTPTFTALSMPLARALEALGGAAATRADAVAAPPPVEGWYRLARLDELEEGRGRLVYCGGEAVAVFRAAGGVYAVNDRCPHARGPLCDGRLGAPAGRPSVTCPWHDTAFDLATGEVLTGPSNGPATIYETKIEGGVVYARVGAADPVPTPAAAR